MLSVENTLLLAIDFQERLMPAMRDREELERNVETFIRGCRLLGVPVLATQQYTRGLGDTLPSLKDALGKFEPVEKITFSCCDCPEFITRLEGAGKKNILVTGIEAHICVQQTVMDLLEKECNVHVVADCIGSRSETDRIYAEKRMQQAGAVLTTMESVLFEFLKSADHPLRKEISNLVK